MRLSLDSFRAGLQPGTVYRVAFSGGLDSTVLLDLMQELRFLIPFELQAVHVHHGLLAEADGWSRHCAEVAGKYGIVLDTLRVDACPRPGESPEGAARTARYRAFEALLNPGDILLTAQHLDDQAETLLLQLMRGAGLPGLAAMPAVAPFGRGMLHRPLLRFSRREILEYARNKGLTWIEDPSNRDERYDRNFIRRRIMPQLATRWPAIAANLARSAGHCAEAAGLLDKQADTLAAAATPADDPASLDVIAVRALPPDEQRLLLRRWIKKRGLRAPSAKLLERIRWEILESSGEHAPAIAWADGDVRRYRQRLYLVPPATDFAPSWTSDWTGETLLRLPGGDSLVASLESGPGIDPARWRDGTITVRYRRQGDRIEPAGRLGHRELKKLFQEAGLPPWERNRQPIVCIDGRIAAIGGSRWLASEFAGPREQLNVVVHWDQTAVAGNGHRLS
ncbi:tRNA lysidine(34) synthetase TilS [Methylococcus geothermalis]|uniref:tRNA(Ile)-lysidine synthase n=1 Tax=Methylococcus geothermalis TaxID=2681310 RepID=A0A858Q8S7_9GAMM|nr:tRNA lysidine(34) synthetase TilS [Methylococcus geothermalis]QJD30205.1 tRNA lysidine(34) synthetase TilS [Methylococcus geothermalis]